MLLDFVTIVHVLDKSENIAMKMVFKIMAKLLTQNVHGPKALHEYLHSIRKVPYVHEYLCIK
jgi:hypothetical protein